MGFLLNIFTMVLLELKEIFTVACLNNLESFDPEDQSLWKMTRQVMWIPTPLPTRHTRGTRSLRLRESRSPCGHFGGSISARIWSFGPNNHWGAQWGDASILFCACKWALANQSHGSSRRHSGCQSQQGTRPSGIPNRALKHLPPSVVSLLIALFNAIFRSTSRRLGNTHACFRSWNLGRIRRCLHLIDP
jgi:hypothetical protein